MKSHHIEFSSFIIIIVVFLLSLEAQLIVLKDKTSLTPNEIIFADGKIKRRITLGNGQRGVATVP